MKRISCIRRTRRLHRATSTQYGVAVVVAVGVAVCRRKQSQCCDAMLLNHSALTYLCSFENMVSALTHNVMVTALMMRMLLQSEIILFIMGGVAAVAKR